MLIFKDKITLGVFAGIIANIIRNIVGLTTYFLEINAHHIWHFAATAYLTKEEAKTFFGIILGIFNDYAIASILGVITVYFLLYVGFRNYLLKGLVIGALSWLLIFTPVINFKISKINPISIGGSIVFLFNHLLLGILIAIIINKYGKNILT